MYRVRLANQIQKFRNSLHGQRLAILVNFIHLTIKQSLGLAIRAYIASSQDFIILDRTKCLCFVLYEKQGFLALCFCFQRVHECIQMHGSKSFCNLIFNLFSYQRFCCLDIFHFDELFLCTDNNYWDPRTKSQVFTFHSPLASIKELKLRIIEVCEGVTPQELIISSCFKYLHQTYETYIGPVKS